MGWDNFTTFGAVGWDGFGGLYVLMDVETKNVPLEIVKCPDLKSSIDFRIPTPAPAKNSATANRRKNIDRYEAIGTGDFKQCVWRSTFRHF